MTTGVRAVRPHLRGPARASVAPLLCGALVGSLVAGRIEAALLCVGVGLACAVAVGAALPPRRWRVTLLTGALIGWALNLYLAAGTPLPGWPMVAGRHATREGLVLGLLLTLRMAGAFVALQGLRAVWPGERAADMMARGLAPLERLRVPVREARAMLGLALRFAPLLGTEAERIARVQDLRAGRPPRGVGEWLTRRRAATVPLMVGALERAERVALALDARHYRLRPPSAAAGWAGVAAVAGPPGARLPVWIAASLGVMLAGVALLWRA